MPSRMVWHVHSPRGVSLLRHRAVSAWLPPLAAKQVASLLGRLWQWLPAPVEQPVLQDPSALDMQTGAGVVSGKLS